MVQDYDGAAVVDATGERIGTVERSYVDDGGTVRVIAVKLGRLFAKHRLVPIDDAKREDDAIRVPYTKEMVQDSPDVDADEDLEGEALARVRAYYAGTRERSRGDVEDERRSEPPTPAAERTEATVAEVRPGREGDASGATADDAEVVTGIRDRGDVIEIPIVEEELVKRPVVREVLRIRKSTIVERQDVDEELRKEDVEIDQEGDVDVQVDDRRRS